MKPGLVILAAAFLAPVAADAQTPAVVAGARVRVTAPSIDLRRHATTIVDVRGDSLVLGVRDGSRSVALSDVTALDVSAGKRRRFLRSAGLGLGIGAIVGAVVGAATHDECVPTEFLDCLLSPESRAESAVMGGVVLGAVGLLTGAVVGAVRRTDRWVAVDMPVRVSIKPTASGGVSLTISRAF
jgi:hypothetical protein